ncbi:hypothetical protein S40288_10313 [Stachybotrys chartarum IBT 40288]|nr:hypothetical protein S40288_10313 [Stachybotrys chartarum IBT 40288]
MMAPAFLSPLIQLTAAHGHMADVRVNGGSWIQGCDPNWHFQPAGSAPNTAGWKVVNQDNGFVSPNAFRSSDIACLIALYAAGQPNGAQAHPQCLRINLGGSASLSGGVPDNNLYSANDQGMIFSLYGSFDSYPIPGSAVGGPSGDGGNSPPVTTLLPTTT